MPVTEAPEELTDTISSLSSLSSGGSSSGGVPANLSDNENNINNNDNLNNMQFEFPIYEKIMLPTEPSLDELLKQVSGTSALENVKDIKLRVVSHMISLQRIHLFMPNLIDLDLEGSIINSLRDLGCDMSILKKLNVSRCGLRSLDGSNGFPAVEELIADFNSIEDVSQCCTMVSLKRLSLRGNKIHDLYGVSFLELCPNLKNLNLQDNPVTEKKNYRTFTQKSIPQITILDDIVFFESDCVTDLSSSEYQSSSSSPEISIASDKPLPPQQPCREIIENIDPSIDRINRPSSSTSLRHDQLVKQKNDHNQRPKTAYGSMSADTTSELTSGQPLCGSIISRRRRQRVAWADDSQKSSTSSSCSSDSIANIPQQPVEVRNFPNQLPQKSIELELGVIGVQQGGSTVDENKETTSQSLLEAARLWRNQSQKTRESIKHNDNLRILREYSGDSN